MNVYKYLAAVHSPDGPEDHLVRTVLMVLAKHRNLETEKCCPGTRRIAEHARMARNTVRAKLDDAEAEGWIRRTYKKRGGKSGQYTQYELVIPSHAQPSDEESGSEWGDPHPFAERVSPGVTHSTTNEGQPRVTHPPDTGGSTLAGMRVNSEPERVNPTPNAGQSWGDPEQLVNNLPKQQEQRSVRNSTKERPSLNGNGTARTEPLDASTAAKLLARDGESRQRWNAYFTDYPDNVPLAARFRVDIDAGRTQWERGQTFATPDVLEEWKETALVGGSS